MAERYPPTFRIGFNVGYATDLIPQVRAIDHFTRLENVIFEQSGALRKVGGSARINSTAMTGGPNVMGMFDAWYAGTSGTFTQKFIAATSDSKIYKEDMDGTFDDITGAAVITANAVPVFAQFDDLTIMCFSTNDTPLSWNGAAASVSSLAGSPPAGRGAIEHMNRLWIWSANANPSRVTYSAYGDPETWSGADTGIFDIDIDDGDRIIGAVSHKERLIIFKGPNRGSIHIIEGRTPGEFTRTRLVRGIALVGPNATIEAGDDVWFASRRGIHSLSATERFGNFAEADLTRFQRGFFRTNVSLTAANLARISAVNYATKSCALWGLTAAGQTDPNLIFGLSYIRAQEEGIKAFTWTNRSCFSAATRINPTTGLEEVVFGTTDGFCERQDTTGRRLANNTAYALLAETPQVILAPESPRADQPVTLTRMYLKSQPLGDWDVGVSIQRDALATENYSFNQGVAGFLLGTDILGIGVLGGAIAQTAVNRLTGSARSARFTFRQGGLNEDAHLYEAGVDYELDATTMEAS